MFKKNKKGFTLIETMLSISAVGILATTVFLAYDKVSFEVEKKDKITLLDEVIQATIKTSENLNMHDINLKHFGLSSVRYYLSEDTRKKLWGEDVDSMSEDDFQGNVLLKSGDYLDVVYNCTDEDTCHAVVGISAYTISKSNQTRNCISMMNHYNGVYQINLSGPAGVLNLDKKPTGKEISDWCDYGWAYGYSIVATRLPVIE